MNDDIIAVIPAYNEAASIGQTLDELLPVLRSVVVVDDGSSDETAVIAKAHEITVLRLATNLYYGGALQAGIKYALRRGAKIIVTLDADGQHDPVFIPHMIKPIQDGIADYVVGSRFLTAGGAAGISPREIGIRIFAAAASFLLDRRITDPTSGFLAMTREVAEVFAGPLFPQDYPDADILIMLDRMGFRLMEVPVIMRSSRSGGSMHSGILKPLYYMIKMSISIINLATRGDLLEKRREAGIAL